MLPSIGFFIVTPKSSVLLPLALQQEIADNDDDEKFQAIV